MPNYELLRDVLTHISLHPNTWNQETWGSATPCGTTYCLAGHVVMMSDHDVSLHWIDVLEVDVTDSAQRQVVSGVIDDGRLRNIDEVAAEILDIPYATIGHLFYSFTSDVQTLWNRIEDVTNGAIEAGGYLDVMAKSMASQATSV